VNSKVGCVADYGEGGGVAHLILGQGMEKYITANVDCVGGGTLKGKITFDRFHKIRKSF